MKTRLFYKNFTTIDLVKGLPFRCLIRVDHQMIDSVNDGYLVTASCLDLGLSVSGTDLTPIKAQFELDRMIKKHIVEEWTSHKLPIRIIDKFAAGNLFSYYGSKIARFLGVPLSIQPFITRVAFTALTDAGIWKFTKNTNTPINVDNTVLKVGDRILIKV